MTSGLAKGMLGGGGKSPWLPEEAKRPPGDLLRAGEMGGVNLFTPHPNALAMPLPLFHFCTTDTVRGWARYIVIF